MTNATQTTFMDGWLVHQSRQTTFIDGWLGHQAGDGVYTYPLDSLDYIRGWWARAAMEERLEAVRRRISRTASK